jgi:hypothetical protein
MTVIYYLVENTGEESQLVSANPEQVVATFGPV